MKTYISDLQLTKDGQQLSHERPSVSVCMAVYNGAQYIREQVESILPQLGPDDEIVAVDDASPDTSVAILECFHDPRIRIIRQAENRGVLRTFERALREASGEIIFLADQDDIWREDKVEKMTGMFLSSPDLTLVISDASIIDAGGKLTGESQFQRRPYHPGLLRNFLQNGDLGCAMAFRRCLLKACLPFPADTPMHDIWIGMVNRMVGKARLIREPLMYYRRHGNNTTSDKRSSMMQKLRWRYALAKNLTWRYLQKVKLAGYGSGTKDKKLSP
jgi:glycosyltransferase involved in cell wall biosynthesis